jgi:hypothetical protein
MDFECHGAADKDRQSQTNGRHVLHSLGAVEAVSPQSPVASRRSPKSPGKSASFSRVQAGATVGFPSSRAASGALGQLPRRSVDAWVLDYRRRSGFRRSEAVDAEDLGHPEALEPVSLLDAPE